MLIPIIFFIVALILALLGTIYLIIYRTLEKSSDKNCNGQSRIYKNEINLLPRS